MKGEVTSFPTKHDTCSSSNYTSEMCLFGLIFFTYSLKNGQKILVIPNKNENLKSYRYSNKLTSQRKEN